MYTHAPLIIDVAGFALTDADRQRLAHPLVGGLILFGRNWQSREQLTNLCQQVKAVRPDLLIAVDHEGGRVQRFRTDGFTHLPPMATFGQLWMSAPEKGEGVGGPALRAANAAVAARPEFAAARARLLQSESQLEAARAQRRPTLSATASGSVSYAAVLTGNGLAGISESVNAGLNFSWPVFDATARANIVTAERNLEAARAALDAQSMQVRAAAVQAGT